MTDIREVAGIAAILVAPLLLSWTASAAPKKGEYLVYVGTYNRGGSKGIYAYRFDSGSGKLTPAGLAGEAQNPSFLAVHPNRKFLYAVSEVASFNGEKSGAVAAFSIDTASGKLTPLNKVSSRGTGPCYVMVDNSGKNVLVANYNSGSVAALPIGPDGRLGEATASIQHTGTVADPKRQGGPHAHSINPSADNRFAIAADLGLDKLFVYRLDAAKGTLAPNDPPFAAVKPRSGPRHFSFHPKGRFGYVINEIASTVTAFSYDPKRGAFKELQTVSTLPADFQGVNNTAEIRVHPSGKFLYGSNRGHDSIAVFAIDGKKGTLTPVEQTPSGGKVPRNFNIDPTGGWLLAANQDSGNIVVFRIDANTGRLTPTGQSVEVGAPVCVKFMALN